MPSWIATRNLINNRGGDYDGVRRENIRAVEEITGRPLIIYASAFLETQKAAIAGTELIINNNDVVAFDEVLAEIEGDSLDILLHSPGGFPEAAEAIVTLLRARYTSLRFIVPLMAKSAATMMCCAGDEILMDERSELGPIDPQLLIRRGNDSISAPAQAILRQFDKAKESLAADPQQVSAWLPLLQPLGPSLLTECEAANDLARNLVTDWLQRYMFKGRADALHLASQIATYLADFATHLSHSRRIGIEQLRERGVVINDMRNTPRLRMAVWNLYHAIAWTLQDTAAFKIVENGHGGAFIRSVMVQQLVPPVHPRSPAEGIAPGVPGAPPTPQPTRNPPRRNKKRR